MRPLLLLLSTLPLIAQERVNLQVIQQIKQEAFANSKVMDHVKWLTDVYGPRLTASPEYDRAAIWAMGRMREWGLAEPHLEKWGPFGRSWTVEQYSAEMVKPSYANLTARPLAWSGSTPGPITAPVHLAPLTMGYSPKKASDSLAKFMTSQKGKLKGKIVLLSEATPVPDQVKPQFLRYTDAELASVAQAPELTQKPAYDINNLDVPDDPEKMLQFFMNVPNAVLDKLFEQVEEVANRRNRFLIEEGVAAVVTTDARSVTGTVFAEAAGSYRARDPLAPPSFVVTREQYNRLVRLLELKQAVELRLNLKAIASEKDVDGTNVIAEITGASKPNEVVMVGAHFDTWHTGTGATDNTTGTAVMMEVMRILKALNLKMDRTVRIGLWGGEEQGLFGSKAYVKEHFGDPDTMKTKPGHARFSVYFNHDNGSGKIRGVYLQENDAARPVFEAWLAPFHDLGAKTITIRNTSGTDHLSFDAVGLPGFQFIQDPLSYMTITHHSDMDTLDHVEPGDLMQASAIIASMVYHAATRPELFPRKPMPKP
jgi:carboxypeptidase Q